MTKADPIADEISELASDLRERFTGSPLVSAWLDRQPGPLTASHWIAILSLRAGLINARQLVDAINAGSDGAEDIDLATAEAIEQV